MSDNKVAVTFAASTKAKLNSVPIVNGQLVQLIDGDALYYDIDNSRHEVTGIRFVDSIPASKEDDVVGKVLYVTRSDIYLFDGSDFIKLPFIEIENTGAGNAVSSVSINGTKISVSHFTALTPEDTQGSDSILMSREDINKKLDDKSDKGHTHRLDSSEIVDGSTYVKFKRSERSTLESDSIKLSGIEEGANKTIVDSEMSTVSTNPVSNKVVNDAISRHSGDKNNPHGVTYSQVGAASSDHTHTMDDILDSDRGNYVRVSKEEYEKLKSLSIDSSLSTTSTNPVQNKVVTEALKSHDHSDNKINLDTEVEDGESYVRVKKEEYEKLVNLQIDSELDSSSENPVQNKAIVAALSSAGSVAGAEAGLPVFTATSGLCTKTKSEARSALEVDLQSSSLTEDSEKLNDNSTIDYYNSSEDSNKGKFKIKFINFIEKLKSVFSQVGHNHSFSDLNGVLPASKGGTGQSLSNLNSLFVLQPSDGKNKIYLDWDDSESGLNGVRVTIDNHDVGRLVTDSSSGARLPTTKLSGTVSISKGGTGASSASGARNNLQISKISNDNLLLNTLPLCSNESVTWDGAGTSKKTLGTMSIMNPLDPDSTISNYYSIKCYVKAGSHIWSLSIEDVDSSYPGTSKKCISYIKNPSTGSTNGGQLVSLYIKTSEFDSTRLLPAGDYTLSFYAMPLYESGGVTGGAVINPYIETSSPGSWSDPVQNRHQPIYGLNTWSKVEVTVNIDSPTPVLYAVLDSFGPDKPAYRGIKFGDIKLEYSPYATPYDSRTTKESILIKLGSLVSSSESPATALSDDTDQEVIS